MFINKFTTWMCNSVNRMYTLTPGRWRNGKTMQSPTDLSNNWTTELHPLMPVLNIVLLILKLFWIISMFLKSKTINCNNLNETNIYTCVYKTEEKFKKIIADDGQRTLWGHWLFLLTEIPHLIYQWELLLIFHLGHKLLSFLRWDMLPFVYDFLGNWNWKTCRCK